MSHHTYTFIPAFEAHAACGHSDMGEPGSVLQRQTFIAFMSALAALTAVLALIQNNRYRAYCLRAAARIQIMNHSGANAAGTAAGLNNVASSIALTPRPGMTDSAAKEDLMLREDDNAPGVTTSPQPQHTSAPPPGQANGASKPVVSLSAWEEAKLSGKHPILLDMLRALSSTVVFLSLCMLTGTGPTCLFPNPMRTGTKVPPYVGPCVNVFLVAVLGSAAKLCPGLVMAAQPADKG